MDKLEFHSEENQATHLVVLKGLAQLATDLIAIYYFHTLSYPNKMHFLLFLSPVSLSHFWEYEILVSAPHVASAGTRFHGALFLQLPKLDFIEIASG